MSVISSVTVTPNRVEIITRYLESCGERGVSRDDLMAQLSPEALRQRRVGASDDGDDVGDTPSSVVTEALTETLRLGLAERFDNDGIESVRFVAPPGPKATSLLERLERILLDGSTAEAAGQREFRRALAWLLAQDPRHPIDTKQNVSTIIQKQRGSEDASVFELTSTNRAQNFYYWARYLGYALYIGQTQKSSAQGETLTVVVPDPTAAIERHLSHLMTPGQTWPLAQLVDSWGDLASVLEGGAARTEVEALMQPALRPPNGRLSRSTSLALERLDRRGVIHLELRADASVTLLDAWPDPLPFTHVTYLRTA